MCILGKIIILYFVVTALLPVESHILVPSGGGSSVKSKPEDDSIEEWDPGHTLSFEDRKRCFRCVYLDGDVFLIYPHGDLRNVTRECVEYVDMKNVDRRPDIFLVYNFFFQPHHCNRTFHYRLFFKYDYEFLEPYGRYGPEPEIPARPKLPNLYSKRLESWKSLGLTFAFHKELIASNATQREVDIVEEENGGKEEGIAQSRLNIINGTLYWSTEVVVQEETTKPERELVTLRPDGDFYHNYDESISEEESNEM